MKFPYGYFNQQLRSSAQIVCESTAGSRIKVYFTKVLEFDNVVLDFSKRKIYGDRSIFEQGFGIANCRVPSNYSENSWKIDDITRKFINSHKLPQVDEIISNPVIKLTRDDCGNTYHALADFVKIYTTGVVVDIDPAKRHVMVMDEHIQIQPDPDNIDTCLYHGAVDALGRLGVLRAKSFQDKKVLFKKLIFPFEKPQEAQLNLIWNADCCDLPEILGSYVENLFDYFGLESYGARKRFAREDVRITFSSRRKKPFSNSAIIGRVIVNEDELIDALKRIPGVRVTVVEFFLLDYKEQIKLLKDTDILIGMHGAGLTNIIYTPPHAHLIELIPYTWESPEYFHLTRATGREYHKWRNPDRKKHLEDGCKGLEEDIKDNSKLHICRTGTSKTIADVEAIKKIVEKAVSILNKPHYSW